MSKRKINFWIITVVGSVAFAWMIAELFRVLSEQRNPAGLAAIASDGVVEHKIGELMVGVPFVAILALSNLWNVNRIYQIIRYARPVMIVGGILNALAWFNLGDRIPATDFLRIWCLIIFAFGLIGAWLLGRLVEKNAAP